MVIFAFLFPLAQRSRKNEKKNAVEVYLPKKVPRHKKDVDETVIPYNDTENFK